MFFKVNKNMKSGKSCMRCNHRLRRLLERSSVCCPWCLMMVGRPKNDFFIPIWPVATAHKATGMDHCGLDISVQWFGAKWNLVAFLGYIPWHGCGHGTPTSLARPLYLFAKQDTDLFLMIPINNNIICCHLSNSVIPDMYKRTLRCGSRYILGILTNTMHDAGLDPDVTGPSWGMVFTFYHIHILDKLRREFHQPQHSCVTRGRRRNYNFSHFKTSFL